MNRGERALSRNFRLILLITKSILRSLLSEPVSAIAIVAGGALATLLAGLAFALRPLAARPAQVLRARE